MSLNSFIRLIPRQLITSLLISSAAFAGTRDGGGNILGPAMPNGDFSYSCDLSLRDPRTDKMSKAHLDLTRKAISDNGGFFEIPSNIWIHGTLDMRKNGPFVQTDVSPNYSLKHFGYLSFAQDSLGSWLVELRANVLFKEKESGASATTLADFSSKMVGAKVSASDRVLDQALELSVACKKSEE